MKDSLTGVLAACLEDIERGECSEEECLELHPQHREALAALLHTAATVRARSDYTPRGRFRATGRARLVAQLKARQPAAPRWSLFSAVPGARLALSTRFVVPLLAVLLVSLAGAGVVHASGSALAGDALYPLKLTVEDTRLFFSDDAGDVVLLTEILQTRVDEMQALAEAGREDDLRLAADPFCDRVAAAARALAAVAQGDAGRAAELALPLQQALSSHSGALADLVQALPDDARPAVERAARASQRGQAVVGSILEDGIPGCEPVQAPPVNPLATPAGERAPEGGPGSSPEAVPGEGAAEEPVDDPSRSSETPPEPGGPNGGPGGPNGGPVGPTVQPPGQGPPQDVPGNPPETRPGGGPPQDVPGSQPETPPRKGPPEGMPAGPPDVPAGPPAEKPGKPPHRPNPHGNPGTP